MLVRNIQELALRLSSNEDAVLDKLRKIIAVGATDRVSLNAVSQARALVERYDQKQIIEKIMSQAVTAELERRNKEKDHV